MLLSDDFIDEDYPYKSPSSETLLKTDPPIIANISDDSRMILFEVYGMPTGCEEATDILCINHLGRIINEEEKYGGLWKIDYYNHKLSHIYSYSGKNSKIKSWQYNSNTNLIKLVTETSSLDIDLNGKIQTSLTPSTTTDITNLSNKILPLLKTQDFTALAKYVHPTLGLRFSPYSFISDSSVKFTPAQLPNLPTNTATYLWGYADGSGLPFRFTFADYYKKYIFDRDYTKAPQSKINELIETGNTKSNISEFFPNSKFVEYNFPGVDPKLESMDWSSLRLVFQGYDGTWYLVCIIHDQWTI